MKKQLLLGSALLAAISAFPQTGRLVPKGTLTASQVSSKYFSFSTPVERTQPAPIGPVNSPNTSNVTSKTTKSAFLATKGPTVTTWQPISGSMNVYGVLESNCRPLSFNDELNLVTFVHRKSATY